MPSVYVHLSGRDVDKALLKAHGIEEESEEAREEDNALKPILCPRCKTKNPPGYKFCGKCSMVLTPGGMELVEVEKDDLIKRIGELEKAVKLETASAKFETLLKVLAEDPRFTEAVKRAVGEGGGQGSR